ncbi:4-coumarate--CoA ligase 1-like [Anoplophora glabripennis]|uniref:4-coumarate--CoA ligase 1-like n=1 Tax=Anoplophora glabripennis TaxID=217634 RepID=UPI0008742F47|nr:4-coumarate--CoA ligase 1-like [Anoplophora glabripennis]
MSVDDKFVIYGPDYGGPLPKNTLGQEILESLLSTNGNDIAMEDAFTGRKLSYKTLLQEVCNLAEALRNYGCLPGTVISVSSENNLEFFIPVLASLLIGCIVAPINHSYTETELNHTLNISKPKVVFCSSEVVDKFVKLKLELGFIDKIIIIDSNLTVSGNPQTETLKEYVFNSLKGRTVLPYNFRPFVDDTENLGAFILCSSGTTGLPKGVLLSHLNIMVRIAHSRISDYYFMKKADLGLMPFFHGFGLNVTLGALLNKDKVIVMKRFDEDIFLKSIQDYKIGTLSLAPPLAVFLEKSPKVLKYDLSCIEDIICGAAPLSKHTENAIRKRLINLKTLRQGYGLSEATLTITMIEKGKQREGSSGKVMNHMAMKIQDPVSGKSLGPNQVGEICIKGPLVMIGYYNNEKATTETFTSDGWLKTGDLAYYDDEKYFYIVDRLKELIKYKGYQVAPAELEAILLKHPKVRDVGVVGLPDELSGELPLAFVVLHDGVSATEKELQLYVASLLSPQKHLRGGVIFISEIPKNPSGKILRRILREKAKHCKPRLETKL